MPSSLLHSHGGGYGFAIADRDVVVFAVPAQQQRPPLDPCSTRTIGGSKDSSSQIENRWENPGF